MVRAATSVARRAAPRLVAVGLLAAGWLLVNSTGTGAPPDVDTANQHWAYQRLVRPTLPRDVTPGWAINPIDRFTSRRMREYGLIPSSSANRATQIRRLTLGLTGLPPTLNEIDYFLNDASPLAYQALVERLLASPRFGERMATPWLDLARYADTHGYHMDAHREMSAWRDWVIDALNANMPFNQFTIEQIAGDLLPEATDAQVIASGFNRNNMVNFENGALADEYLTEYAVDRTVTTSTVWLGQTMQCARCHDHKYDPFTQRDFYQLLAFFNQVPEQGIDGDRGNAAPFVSAPSSEQRARADRLRQRLADADRSLRQREANCEADLISWQQSLANEEAPQQPPSDMRLYLPLDEVTDGTTLERVRGERASVQGPTYLPKTKFERGLLFGGETFIEFDTNPLPTTANHGPLSFAADESFTVSGWIYPTTDDRMTLLAKRNAAPMQRGYSIGLEDTHVTVVLANDQTKSRIEVRTLEPIARSEWQHLTVTYDGSRRAGGLRVFIDGDARPYEVIHNDLQGATTTATPLRIGGGPANAPFRGVVDDLRIYARPLTATEVGLLAGGNPIGEILAVATSDRSPHQQEALRSYYLRHHDRTFQRLVTQRNTVARALKELEQAIPTSMVMRDSPTVRPTHILTNGMYDARGERVEPNTPATFFPLPTDGPRNRLGFARWLVDPRHPLTARVAVNRIWQLHFGSGLVRTPEDFGTRGERPSHPRLLDWLASELISSGWDTKHIHRLIVTSATYRQSSQIGPEQWRVDPTNRWLARGPRGRLSAEMIRDQALAISGLLHEQLGGPSVFPYQPAGLWKELSYDSNEFSAQVYEVDHGANLYRRSLYTFWKRSAPSPALATLGAPNREVCVTRRSPTNTPLEALTLMNETALVEASRKLAERVLTLQDTTDDQRLAWAFRCTTGRLPSRTETETLKRTLIRQRQIYGQDEEAARRLTKVGDSAWNHSLDPSELAAWTLVSNLLLCLDETITTH